MRRHLPATVVFWSLAGGVCAADLLTKWLAYDGQVTSREVQILPGVFFCFEPAANMGIAWGLLSRWPQIIIWARAIAAAAVICYFLGYSRRGLMETLATGGILGGAVGNLFDGFFLGFVRDFLAFRILSYKWPNFNLADSFISIGAVVLIGYMLFDRRDDTLAGRNLSANSGKRRESGE